MKTLAEILKDTELWIENEVTDRVEMPGPNATDSDLYEAYDDITTRLDNMALEINGAVNAFNDWRKYQHDIRYCRHGGSPGEFCIPCGKNAVPVIQVPIEEGRS